MIILNFNFGKIKNTKKNTKLNLKVTNEQIIQRKNSEFNTSTSS